MTLHLRESYWFAARSRSARMRQDILEQLVDDHLQYQGYFTRHNLKFRPSAEHLDYVRNLDSNHSDIDVIGVHPKRSGVDRVVAVSCKSWQSGFDVRSKLAELTGNKKRSGRASWKFFRELVEPKWSEAFLDAVEAATGTRTFTYVLAVTAVRGDRASWENHPTFRAALGNNPIRLVALDDMVREICSTLTTSVVPSQLGRTLQLLKAAGIIEARILSTVSEAGRQTNSGAVQDPPPAVLPCTADADVQALSETRLCDSSEARDVPGAAIRGSR